MRKVAGGYIAVAGRLSSGVLQKGCARVPVEG